MTVIADGSNASSDTSPFFCTPMVIDDIPEVIAIEKQSFPIPWADVSYRRELMENDLSHYWTIRTREGTADLPALLAYGGYWVLHPESHISTIASHPDCRRCKLGEWMMLVMMAQARGAGVSEMTLEVRISNDAAIALYTNLGFVEVGLRKKYYASTWTQPAEDALLLTLFRLDEESISSPLAQRLKRVQVEAQDRLLTHSSTRQRNEPTDQ
jgi:ribosomal-protein-alanine N-acetyltransferase